MQLKHGRKWNHLECPDCEHLRNDIFKTKLALKKANNEENMLELMQIKKSLEEQLDRHFHIVQGNHVILF